jgi:acetaldehyde dehydrogenase (acetylating)
VDSDLVAIQDVRERCRTAAQAAIDLQRFTQAELNAIVEAMARAAYEAAEQLAEMAVEDTRLGNVHDKTLKNVFASWTVYQYIKDLRTTGVIRERSEEKILEIAEPVGVIAAILPTTNPTSTAINKALIALKSGNSIIMSPHPRAARCVQAAVDILLNAAVKAGAPDDCISTLAHPTLAATQALMTHREVKLILATGGPAMVRAAYSAGKPAYGVGPGNVPVFLEKSAKTCKAIRDILVSKTFDYGTLCTSEQSLIVEDCHKERVVRELIQQQAYFTTPEESDRLAQLLVKPDGSINPAVVGQSPRRLAEMASITVPAETVAFVTPQKGVGKAHPLSIEKLSPVLAFYVEPDPDACIRRAVAVANFGGKGHSAIIHSKDEEIIRHFAQALPTYRILVNTPGDHGGVGMTTGLTPSMSLGSGTISGCITTDHVSPLHLINIKRVAYELNALDDAPLKQPGESFDAVPGANVRTPGRRYNGYKKWDDPPIQVGPRRE